MSAREDPLSDEDIAAIDRAWESGFVQIDWPADALARLRDAGVEVRAVRAYHYVPRWLADLRYILAPEPPGDLDSYARIDHAVTYGRMVALIERHGFAALVGLYAVGGSEALYALALDERFEAALAARGL